MAASACLTNSLTVGPSSGKALPPMLAPVEIATSPSRPVSSSWLAL
jgi:hypothetical protein